MSPTLTDHLHISPEVLYQRVADELVILDLAGERYYSLNAAGARIWDLLVAGQTPGQITEIVAREFATPAAQVQEDVLRLIGQLVAASLATVATK